MNTRDQVLLEEAYKKVAQSTLFRDKNNNPLNHGDHVIYNKTMFKIVGGKSVLGIGNPENKIQIEPLEYEESIPKLLWVKPSQLIKIKR
jgi:hypothetical protein